MGKNIEIKCKCGNEITIDLTLEDLEWEIIETNEREMGIETLHESIIYYPCDECEEELMITLHIWEYPAGFANIDNIEVDDESCELIKRCDIRELLDL